MTWRRPGSWATTSALCVALATCALLYQRSRSLDVRAHADLADLLSLVRQLDSDLGKQVLASRYGLINQYDALTRSGSELTSSRAEIRALQGKAVADDERSKATTERLEHAERALLSDVESFKTQNSILKNSLIYLPLAGDTLTGKMNQERSRESLSMQTAIQTLVRSTLIYNSTRTDSLRESLLAQQAELGNAVGQLPEPLRPELMQLLRHARTALLQQEQVDPLVARISSSTLSRAVGDLQTLSDQHLEYQERLANRYRVAVSALVILLVGLLCGIGVQLKRLYQSLERQVLERTQKLADEKVALELAETVARINESRINAIIEGAREGIVRLDPFGRVRSWNPAAAQMFEASWKALGERRFVECAVPPDGREAFQAWLERAGTDGCVAPADYWYELSLLSSTRTFAAECSVARRDPSADDEVTLFVRDISQAKQLEAELRQAQKLESVGRLASGIAHEINTPIQFVSDSCFFVKEALAQVFQLVSDYSALLSRAIPPESREAARSEARALEDAADLPYLLENAPKSLDTMVDGLSRVAELVAGMKTFAHPDQKEKALVDLNHALKTTLVIARNEYKYVADVASELGDIPSVLCHAGEVNQVILNLLVNAAHAIGDRVSGTEQRGLITVRTHVEKGAVVISVSDTGNGIPAEVQARIFEPFFTTKAVGRGTGQGLAIARAVIVQKHGGQLRFESEVGKGTTFHVLLPINESALPSLSAA